MSVLAGPFAIAAVLVACGGALKAWQPTETAGALAAAGVRMPGRISLRSVVRLGGIAEVVVGLGALVTGGPVFAALLALSYAAFAAFVAVALRRRIPISSCGCFGKVDTPPSTVHVVIDGLAAVVAAAAAVVGGVALPDVVADQPLAGVPYLLLVAVGCYLAFLAFTALPKTMAAVREVNA